MNVNDIMNASTDRRDCDLHVQISKKNKRFLRQQSKNLGVVMGLYLDKIISTVRALDGEKRRS